MQRGHIVKQENGYAVLWREADPGKPGHHRLRQKGGFRTRELANQWLKHKLAEVQMAAFGNGQEMTVSQLIERHWLHHPAKSRNRGQWMRANRCKIKALLDDVKVNDLDAAAINSWKDMRRRTTITIFLNLGDRPKPSEGHGG